MSNSNLTQCDRIMRYLYDFGSITQLEALNDLGIMRLASRISEMRKRGIAIKSEMIASYNRYGDKVRYAKYEFDNDNKG